MSKWMNINKTVAQIVIAVVKEAGMMIKRFESLSAVSTVLKGK